MTLAPGAKLGTYEIIGLLGAGGMGEVYRARDPQLGREVAIKILPASLSRDPERLRRFEQEARAAAALNHPNILAVYQFGTHDGAPYLVSELLEGGTLRENLARGPWPFRKAIDCAAQTARGLAAAHEKGIVHRDLKPENLFVTNDGRIKILDFGLAKLIQKPQSNDSDQTLTVSGQTEPGMILGTVGYMAPEQVRGQNADHRADLFALGAILYEMLTGQRSFQRPTSAETMTAILNDDPPAISTMVADIPPALQRVVQRCLEKNPEQRFHSASDLAFALEALSDPGSAASGGSRAGERSKIAVPAMIAGAALLVLVAAAFLWLEHSNSAPTIESVVQLTNDPNGKTGTIETDGARIYFNQGAKGNYKVAQVSVNGGQTAEIATPLSSPQIAGLSADGSRLLLLDSPYLSEGQAMWSLPLPAGEPRRLGNASVQDASMFPDGRLIYRLTSGIFTAEKDGSNPTKIEALSKYRVAPDISADGKHLLFDFYDKDEQVSSFYDVSADGSSSREVLKSGSKSLPALVCCPRFTADQKYLIFLGGTDDRLDLWALANHTGIFGGSAAPVRLTSGPLTYTAFATGRNNNQIFAIAAQRRGELVRYDPRVKQFVPFLGGISALDPTFSRDGQWVTYVSYPDASLWRSRADGSERLQLTYSPTYVNFARISPDGSRVAFSDGNGSPYVMSINGGTPQKLADFGTAPDWSPDGSALAVTHYFANESSPSHAYYGLQILDSHTGKVTDVPDSKEKVGPWFISQDEIIAVTQDQSKFQIFNFKTQKWSDIISSPGQFINWESSSDLKYFLYSSGGNNPRVFRMKIADRSIEEVLSVKDFVSVSSPAVSVSPDDWPVMTQNTGTEEVYSLTVKWQ